MKELFPADMAAHINVDQVADIVWRYSVGEITAVDLLIEGAVAAMFTEQAAEGVRATAECVMSELTKTAPDAFGQITDIVDGKRGDFLALLYIWDITQGSIV